ncbi:MAG: hypothetical protein CMC55_02210 [Flavobacteriaceae bacterium]|nr:hypothetical protein [Flavobacteriaceae bacterium]
MKVKINTIQSNQYNPRLIKEHKFKKLVKSIKAFPEMLSLRPIVVDEHMTILGGNMRFRACVEAGLKEIDIKIAEGLTEEQKKEFIVKDNVGYGEWDWTMLGNEWKSNKLDDWGLDVWQNIDDNIGKVNRGDENSEWVGMPDFDPADNTLKIIIHFENEQDREAYAKEHNIEFTKKLPSAWSTYYPYEGRKDMKSLKYE